MRSSQIPKDCSQGTCCHPQSLASINTESSFPDVLVYMVPVHNHFSAEPSLAISVRIHTIPSFKDFNIEITVQTGKVKVTAA